MDTACTRVKFKYQIGDLVYLHIYYLPVRGWFLGVITHRVPSMVKGKRYPCYNVKPLNSTQSFMKREEQLRDRIKAHEAGGYI